MCPSAPAGLPRLLTLALLAVLVACGAGPGLPAAGDLRGANLLLITIDTLRTDRLGSYGARHATPALDGLANAGLRFTRAYTHSVMTLPAHASLLTGLTPPRHGVRNNGAFSLGSDATTLAERLRGAGYRTGAFVGAFVLDRRFGLAQGFDAYDDRSTGSGALDFRVAERRADLVLASASDWLRSDSSERPWFAWVHLFDPHTPYQAPITRTGVPYDDEVAYVDQQIGAFLGAQRAAGALDRTLVVVTADHGEALGDHGELTHGLFAYEATLRVPAILAGPGIEPGVVETPLGHVDLMATIVEWLGLEPSGMDGVPLRRLLAAASRGIYFEALDANLTRGWAPLTGVVLGDWKFIDLPLQELYDIADDPEERVNLAGTARDRVQELAGHLRQWTSGAAAAAAPVALDADASARLRSLGYVGGGQPGRGGPFTAADDPKTLLPLHRRFMGALERAERGDANGALDQLRACIGERPTFTAAYTAAASLLIGTGRAAEAVSLLEQAKAKGAGSPEIDQRLAAGYLAAGNPEGTRRLLEPMANVDRPDAEALNLLGVALIQLRRPDEARRVLRRAVETAPGAPGIWTNLGLLEMNAGRPTEASDAFRKATAADPGAVQAWRALGALAIASADARGAVDAWTRAVGLEPDDPDTLFNLGMLLSRTSPDQARPYLERFLRQPGISAADRSRVERVIGGRNQE